MIEAALIVVVVLGAVVGLLGTVIAVNLRERRGFRLAVDALADARNLSPRSGLGDISCGGPLDGLRVVVDAVVTHGSRSGKLCTRIRLSGAPVPSGLLTADGRGARLITGDEAFDRSVCLETDQPLAWRARLDAHTRRELRVAPARGWTLEDGLCALMPADLDEGHALARQVRADPSRSVRETVLEAWLPAGEVPESLLSELATRSRSSLGCRAACALERAELIVPFLGNSQRSVRARAAVGLASLDVGDPSIESELLSALDLDPWRERCIVALGAVGTPVAAQRLGALSGLGREQAKGVRQAVKAIWPRHPVAEPGALSVASSEGGGLSTTDAGRRGRLTEVP